jgi:signal transduction histidine kinase
LLFAANAKGIGYARPRPLEVSEIVRSALRNTGALLEGAGFTVQQEIPSGLPRVDGDLSALSQCLENLLANAVKYGNREPWIGLSAGIENHKKDRKEVWISVADHGVGISSSELSQIFEPFYRCSEAIAAQIHGTGLGLSIAKRITEAFGGRLSVISEVGVGSVFTVHLPTSDEVPESQPEHPQPVGDSQSE